MARVEKTVFISYRRKDISWALAVYQYLTSQKYDVFFDYTSLSGGDFEQVIISNIRARAHFVLILTPTALDRCNEPGDWLRREIEAAIDEKRNIIPLFFEGFNFGSPAVAEKLTGKLSAINRYNGLDIPSGYFMEAMERLSSRYLNVPLNAVIHPVSTEVRKAIKVEQIAADNALKQKNEDIKKLLKPVEDKSIETKQAQSEKGANPIIRIKAGVGILKKKQNMRLLGIVMGILLLLLVGVFGANSLSNANEDRLINEAATQEVAKFGAELVDLSVVRRGNTLHITMTVRTVEPLSYEDVNQIQKNIAIQLQKPVSISIDYELGERLDPLIPPTFTNTPIFAITQTPFVPTATLTYTSTPITPTATPPPFTSTPELGIGSTMTGVDGMTLLYVPAGEFVMGDEGQSPDEKPIHNVYLDSFWIDQTEVTNSMYALCVNDGKCHRPSSFRSSTQSSYYGNPAFGEYPVIYVSWNDAQSYCSWVDRKLPTEAEWEKAARGKDQRTYPWGEQIDCSYANYYDGIKFCIGDTSPVKSYSLVVSPYEAYDMAGNVWEWVADWYGETYYKSLPALSSNPLGSASSQFKVARGGSWYNGNFLSRTSNRGAYTPNSSTNNIGFRCAMDAE